METTYDFTRFLLQRGLGLTYLIAFIAVLHQFIPLLGENGLLPIREFVKYANFKRSPSLFLKWPSDQAIRIVGWVGISLAVLAVTGISERFGLIFSMLVWFSMWALYLSVVNVGQVFYAFGWESMLLEAGFLAIFLGSDNIRTNAAVIWLFKWMLFRVMFGAGLIKLRGDPCWKDLSCLTYFYETQPIPNPLSWYFHWLPRWVHRLGVRVNHFVELVLPFGLLLPQPISMIAGVITLGFHGWLFVSGNFAFLGFLTMVLCFSTVPRSGFWHYTEPGQLFNALILGLVVWMLYLSIKPVKNMLVKHQLMNYSFNPFHIMGTYGAFGSVTQPRYEVVLEGSMDGLEWKEYEFWGKPGDLKRAGVQIAPYHLRLDWLMWFAAFSPLWQHPWLMVLMDKLRNGEPGVLKLLRKDPFEGKAPQHVRALLYQYSFTSREEKRATGNYWKRELLREIGTAS